PFNIEREIYTEWATLLREHIKPDVMICGHVHELGVHEVGGDFDHLGQPCPMVVGARPDEDYFAGCGYVFSDEGITVSFTDNRQTTLSTRKIR
ncbi:MAG: hypothetical protein IKV35_02090, partial [Clostridia bacterium]|nr:hypothetical protein [Clostridia bacterium]